VALGAAVAAGTCVGVVVSVGGAVPAVFVVEGGLTGTEVEEGCGGIGVEVGIWVLIAVEVISAAVGGPSPIEVVGLKVGINVEGTVSTASSGLVALVSSIPTVPVGKKSLACPSPANCTGVLVEV